MYNKLNVKGLSFLYEERHPSYERESLVPRTAEAMNLRAS